jgi:uncharacterized protein (TIGR02996 family)
MTATATGLLAAILDAPEEDTPRLIYADWLDEHGDPARAEFVRVQCALAGGCLSCHCDAPGATCRLCPLRRRERELVKQHGWSWDHAMHATGCFFAFPWPPPIEYRRGFVESVTCTATDWLAHGPAVIACQPVTRVTLSDKVPIDFNRGVAWYRRYSGYSRSDLPPELFAHLPGEPEPIPYVWYPDEGEARSDLSAACIRYAKAVD